MHNTILPFLLLLLMPLSTSAQFYTITKESELIPGSGSKAMKYTEKENDTISNDAQNVRIDTLHIKAPIEKKKKWKVQKGDKRTSQNSVLPELTIPNLYAEIIRNGIRHPKIVLAQAILETGWFTSPVCRNKHNLFGLHGQGNTLSSAIGRKVSGPIIPRYSTSSRAVTISFG